MPIKLMKIKRLPVQDDADNGTKRITVQVHSEGLSLRIFHNLSFFNLIMKIKYTIVNFVPFKTEN